MTNQMFTFCQIMYSMNPSFDLAYYVKLGDVVLTREGYKQITGKDYAEPVAAPAV
nr:MAG TPA: hypothetical protein [Caudoviricetes sp.]